MKTLKNPKNKEIKVKATCAIIGRRPRDAPEKFKNASIGIYDVNNPHKMDVFPKLEYEFSNIEKIRIKGLNVSYYLEGNDIIINDLEELFIIQEPNLLIIKGYQFEVERRKEHKKK